MWSSQKAEEDLEKLAAHAEEEPMQTDAQCMNISFQQDKFSIISNSHSGNAREWSLTLKDDEVSEVRDLNNSQSVEIRVVCSEVETP